MTPAPEDTYIRDWGLSMRPWITRLAQALKPFSGSGQSFSEWKAVSDARLDALSRVFGEPDPNMFHSRTPFNRGGYADVYHFVRPDYHVYVTADLTANPGAYQIPSLLGSYVLVMCAPEPSQSAAELISRLARYTMEAVIEPGHTMDLNISSSLEAAVFLQWPETTPFNFNGVEYGLLLLVGISSAELKLSTERGSDTLIERLVAANVIPVTNPDRTSVI